MSNETRIDGMRKVDSRNVSENLETCHSEERSDEESLFDCQLRRNLRERFFASPACRAGRLGMTIVSRSARSGFDPLSRNPEWR